MDPLSLSASLIAVLGAARASAKVVQKAAAYRHAPQEICTLREELERFEKLLQQAVHLVEDVDAATIQSRGQILAQGVDKASKKIEEIIRLLSSPRGLFAKLSEEKQAKAVWMKNKNKIKTLQTDLKDVWATVNDALVILTA